MRYKSPTVEDAEDSDGEVWGLDPNLYGVYREYDIPLQRDPEAPVPPPAASPDPTPGNSPGTADDLPRHDTIFWMTRNSAICIETAPPSATLGPFDNKSQFRLYDWYYNTSVAKSKENFDDLLDVMHSNNFSLAELEGFSAQRAQNMVDSFSSPSGIFSAEDGWHEGSVNIPLPKTKAKYPSEADAPAAKIDGVFHRRLIEVLKGVARDRRFASQYHWVPHTAYWVPPGREDEDVPASSPGAPSAPSPPDPIRIFTDTYNTDAMQREFRKINKKKARNAADAPSVEYGLLPMIFWSDETRLSSFGSGSLWPIYLYIGALSKYIRGMPTEFAAHHIAYIPSVMCAQLVHELR